MKLPNSCQYGNHKFPWEKDIQGKKWEMNLNHEYSLFV